MLATVTVAAVDAANDSSTRTTTRAALSTLPHPSTELRAAATALFELDAQAAALRHPHRIVAAMYRVAGALDDCRTAGLTRVDVHDIVGPLRELLRRSPLVHRLQTWPRGYPGDFETVEWLCDATNRAEPGTTAWGVEHFCVHSPIAQQHRNKVALQADAIAAVVVTRPDARVLSIGCGGCRDLREILPILQCAPDASFTLVDGDAAALAFATSRLATLEDRCRFVQGHVPRTLSPARVGGPFDLVVAGGLFDYLPDRWAIETLRRIGALLRAGGKVLLSNITSPNPYGPLISCLGAWELIERTDDDLVRLLKAAGFDEADVSIRRDTTGLAAMVTAHR